MSELYPESVYIAVCVVVFFVTGTVVHYRRRWCKTKTPDCCDSPV